MSRIELTTRVGADGAVNIKLPGGELLAEHWVHLVVHVEPVEHQSMTREQWLSFLSETAGSIADPSFVRHEQGELDEVEPLS